MTTQGLVHTRLDFPRAGLALPHAVHLYRLGPAGSPGPLLLYVGGALTERQRAERFETEPLPILEQFEAALGTAPVTRLDLVIAPPPATRSDPSAVLDEFEDFFHDELLPALGGPPPTAMAFIGYSFGAHLVTSLALGQEQSRALVTIGGAGIPEGARAAGRVVPAQLTVVLFHNEGDDLPPPATALGAFEPRLKPWAMPARPGGHEFQAYARNGSVAEAFGLALELLR